MEDKNNEDLSNEPEQPESGETKKQEKIRGLF